MTQEQRSLGGLAELLLRLWTPPPTRKEEALAEDEDTNTQTEAKEG